MGYMLDDLLKKEVISGPESVNADYTTEAIFIGDRELEYSILATYDSGINVNMEWFLQASNDKTNWADVTDSNKPFTDASGSILYDLAGSGFLYARVKIVVTTGDISLTRVLYSGKRRH